MESEFYSAQTLAQVSVPLSDLRKALDECRAIATECVKMAGTAADNLHGPRPEAVTSGSQSGASCIMGEVRMLVDTLSDLRSQLTRL